MPIFAGSAARLLLGMRPRASPANPETRREHTQSRASWGTRGLAHLRAALVPLPRAVRGNLSMPSKTAPRDATHHCRGRAPLPARPDTQIWDSANRCAIGAGPYSCRSRPVERQEEPALRVLKCSRFNTHSPLLPTSVTAVLDWQRQPRNWRSPRRGLCLARVNARTPRAARHAVKWPQEMPLPT